MPNSANQISLEIGTLIERLTASSKGRPGSEKNTPQVYTCVRDRGRRRQRAWIDPYADRAQLLTVVQSIATTPGATVDVTVVHPGFPLDHPPYQTALKDDARGLYALSCSLGEETRRVAPNELIARNRSVSKVLEDWHEAAIGGTGEGKTLLPIRVHQTEQYLFTNDALAEPLALHRGRRPPSRDPINRSAFTRLFEGLVSWLQKNRRSDGLFVYKYWPSRGEQAPSDNSIRQLLGVLAAQRLAHVTHDKKHRALARESLEAAARTLFQRRADFAVVALGGSAKLGASALAGLALLNSEDAQLQDKWLPGIQQGIRSLWAESGHFRTFFEPPERNDNQNFYPGEALYFLSESLSLCTEGREAQDLASRLDGSLRAYRAYHLNQPNPAFVPWHTRAAASLFETTRASWLADYVFALNDWLVTLQQEGGEGFADFAGRFYLPERPDFGPPHASSTAVYCESLVSAAKLAQRLGDGDRFDHYTRCLGAGLSNLANLQYADIRDHYYIQKKDRVLGGLRTEFYDNTIRVDSIAHALLACLDILESPPLRERFGLGSPFEAGDRLL